MLICLVMQSSSIAAVSVMEKHERKAFAVALSIPSVQSSAISNHHGMRKENTVGLHLSILVVLLCLRFTSRAWPTCESPLLEFVGLASITSWTGPFKN